MKILLQLKSPGTLAFFAALALAATSAIAASPVPPAGPAFSVPKPLSPGESLKKLHLPAGYKAEIIAAEPLLIDPVAFDWDERGRLWVVEMSDYPLGMDGNGKPGGRVRVLEDTNGDGRYDKSTIFADGLNFPNGILTWRDGVIITAAPDILFLRDTNGDGKADQKEVLVTGLLEGNQQLRANGLRWGLDNWVYVAAGGHHGKYGTETRLKSLRSGQEIQVGGRDFRFRPDKGELEPQSGPTQFGRNRDNWGRWFGTQNAHPLWHYVLPDHYLRRNPHFGADETRVQMLTPPTSPPVFPASKQAKRYHDFAASIGHFTSACGGYICRDPLLFGPGGSDAFVCEPVHNLVQHMAVTDDGVSFAAKTVFGEGKFDFFASEDAWCRPVMVREGPDGALWVADMYRFMIEHPAWLPKEGKEELLPHYRLGDDMGRIYRVSRTGTPGFRPVRFDNLGTRDLVATLESSGGWSRDKAHQILLWRADKAALAPLLALAEHGKNPFARLHALCVLDGLGELQPATVVRALGDASPGVRENALRLAETRFTPAVLAAAIRLAEDKGLKVRIQLAFSLGESKETAAGEALGRLLIAHADDPMMVAAVMSSATPHIRPLVAAVAGKPKAALADTLLVIALGLNDRGAVASLVSPIFNAGGRYTPEQLSAFARLLNQLAQRNSTLARLRAAQPGDALAQLLGRADAIIAQVHGTAADPNSPPLERIAAAALLSRDPSARAGALPLLTGWLDPKHPAEAQAAAIQALAAIAAPEAPAAFTRAWPTLSPATRQVALTAWMSREPWAFDLVQRLKRKELPVSAVDTTQRARLIKHNSKRISQLAGNVFSSATSERSKIIESYRPALILKGDEAKGHELFTLACAICHKRGEEGRDIGPDLLTVVAHPPEKLLGSILDPSADIQPGFNPYTCTLNTDEEIYGLLDSESGNSVVMKLVDGTKRTVLRNQIKTLLSQNLSLMPEGVETAINHQQMADLIAFLRSPVKGAK
ncbi:MAG: PVC-type heme-binding CxxCH protein [Limisphaerales bacterium]